MKNQEVITFAKFSDFKNDEGQQIRTGKIYILGNKTHKVTDFGESSGNQTGGLKCTLELAKEVIEKGLPGLYNVEYDVSIDRDNAISLTPIAVEFVKELKLL